MNGKMRTKNGFGIANTVKPMESVANPVRKIMSDITPRHDMGVMITRLTNKTVKLESAIKRIRELHSPDYDNACPVCIKDLDYDEYLPIYEEYPCPTIQALDKEDE
jgi:hypothetical protein